MSRRAASRASWPRPWPDRRRSRPTAGPATAARGRRLRRRAAQPQRQLGDAALRLPAIHLVFGLTKRWLLGTHHGAVSKKHLPAYLDEFVFRFNRRTAKTSATASPA